MKIGDYETAEFALKEFIDKNKDHNLAGSAQYWYGETLELDNYIPMLLLPARWISKLSKK